MELKLFGRGQQPEIDLLPAQGAEFGSSQPLPEGEEGSWA